MIDKTLAIIAGGKSIRMGEDKSKLMDFIKESNYKFISGNLEVSDFFYKYKKGL